MSNPYAISDFFVFLKLGIWKSGEVSDWGRVNSIVRLNKNSATGYTPSKTHLTGLEKFPFLKKPVSHYWQQFFIKGNPSTGIYILDSYILSKKKDEQGVLRSYIVVVATARLGIKNKENIYLLKVENYLENINFGIIENGEIKKRRRKSYFRKKPTARRPYFKPIHAKEL